MAQAIVESRKIDPKLTEKYLLNLVGVVDASVFWSQGELNAYLTMLPDGPIDANGVQRCCMEDLGLHQTPSKVTIDLRLPRAA